MLADYGLPARIRTADLQSRSLTRYPAVPQVDILFFMKVAARHLQSLPLGALYAESPLDVLILCIISSHGNIPLKRNAESDALSSLPLET